MPEPIEGTDLVALCDAAVAAATNSYSPYSKFRVGAALRCDDGTVITGVNVESASYGLTNCAERTAMFTAVAAGHRHPGTLAVACPDVSAGIAAGYAHTVMPCGACRQVMTELLAPDARVAVVGVGVFTLDELLPLAFRLGV